MAKSGNIANRRFRAARERLFGSRDALAEAVNLHLPQAYEMNANDIGKIERGVVTYPRPPRRAALRKVLKVETDADLGFFDSRSNPSDSGGVPAAHSSGTDIVVDPRPVASPDCRQAEQIRRSLDDVLSEGAMAEASLDEWELTVTRHGRASRDRAASELLDDLCADLIELQQAVRRHRSASALRRLSRVAAQMSGLICLTLCKLDQTSAFRQWARTARLAAHEAGDPETLSWVLAQEAYGHFYGSDTAYAIDVAQQAQSVVKGPCVGAALAAALEARAHAVMQMSDVACAALGRAQNNLSGLEEDMLLPSAFGYNEAQFRFHEGNVYTHLGNVESAFVATDRALELCTSGDYTDWALTRLDRASCLAISHDTAGSMNYAAATVIALSTEQRRGIITRRGLELLNSLPAREAKLPAARDFRELLTLPNGRKEEPKL